MRTKIEVGERKKADLHEWSELALKMNIAKEKMNRRRNQWDVS